VNGRGRKVQLDTSYLLGNTTLMRQTVYIQDDLLQRAQALLPDLNPSQLVQRGLAQLIGDLQGPIYATAPLHAVAKDLERLRDHFAVEAKAEYERGYRMALAAADSLSWRLLEELAGGHNDLKRVLRPYVNGYLQEAVQAKPLSEEQVDDLFLNMANEETSQPTQHLENEAKPWAWLSRLARDLGSMADPIGYDEYSFDPTRAYLRGYGDALYAVWVAVEEGVDPLRHESGNLLPVRDGDPEHPISEAEIGIVDEGRNP
jgi:hypothetical protein